MRAPTPTVPPPPAPKIPGISCKWIVASVAFCQMKGGCMLEKKNENMVFNQKHNSKWRLYRTISNY